ncbi:MAG: coproporphyrinogen III oxidase, partial [Pseudomonadota bacterium]
AQKTAKHVSLDLIYARPEQTLTAWKNELSEALAFQTNHLSLYQLTFEPSTAFATALKNGTIQAIDSDIAADLFLATIEQMHMHGFDAYELSNFAKPNFESRHNLNYWLGYEYLGVGPGAQSRLNKIPHQNPPPSKAPANDHLRDVYIRPRLPEKWLLDVEAKKQWEVHETLDAATIAKEIVMLGLRLKKGVQANRLKALSGLNFDQVFDFKILSLLQHHGWLSQSRNNIALNVEGWLRLNPILQTSMIL